VPGVSGRNQKPANASPLSSAVRAALLLAAGLLGVLAPRAEAAENIANTSGYWTNAAIWSAAAVPNSGHDVVIPAGITVTNTGLATNFINSLTITGTLTHATNAATVAHKLILNVAGDLTVASGGAIDVSGRGYGKDQGPGKPGIGSLGGAGYGGEGGWYSSSYSRGPTYGSVSAPTDLGSGGNFAATAGCGIGGGAAILTVAGTLTVNGVIRADAPDGPINNNTGGSGGSVFVTAGALAGTNAISANGGTAANVGGGGGGRIAVVLTNSSGFATVTFSAKGGGGAAEAGAAGTVYLKDTNSTYGALVVDAAGRTTGAMTIFTNATYAFDSIRLTNYAAFGPDTNAVLDLRHAPTIVTDGGPTNILSKIVFGRPGSTVQWAAPTTVVSAAFSHYGTNLVQFTNAVSVAAGGVLTHEANGTNYAHNLRLSVAGDLAVASNAAINVSGRGYGVSQGPGKTSNYGGGGYGGEGGAPRGPTYGSISSPTDLGSGGSYKVTAGCAVGGGAAILTVAGTLTVNGVIRADAPDSPSGNNTGGSGGSVFATAGALAGTGAISANGGLATKGNVDMGAGGGGRIAVVLTNSSGFATVTFSARGGGVGSGNGEAGAAGTVYLQASGQTYGNLVVSNNQSTAAATLIGTNVTGAIVGDMTLQNLARLSVFTNRTLAVYGNWSNGTANAVAGGGTVVFAGVTTNTLYGNTTFDNFTCQTPGKTLKFEAGKTNAVTTGIILTGDASSNLVLRSTAAPLTQQWKLNVQSTATTKTFDYVDVQDSDARLSYEKPSPAHFVDSGNNSNWNFAATGQTNYWTGASNSLWSESANWSQNAAPSVNDTKVSLTNGCPRYPYLGGQVTIYGGLEIESGASLRISNQVLIVNGAATIAGALIAAGSETVTFNSNLTFSGATAYTAAQSTLKLSGTGPQAFTPNDNAFYALNIANTNAIAVADAFTAREVTFPASSANVTFGGGFTVTNVSLVVTNGATLTFTSGRTYNVGNALVLSGTAGKPVLMNNAGGSWHLNVSGYAAVRYVTAAYSDASGGRKIYAVNSTDGGSNTNWDFGAGKLWAGTTTSWTNSANWLPAGAPVSTSVVMIDGSAVTNARLTNATTIAGLIVAGVSGPATLTVDTPSTGGVLTVSGNVDIGTNGVLTHTANGSNAQYTLSLVVDGDVTVAPGGAVDVSSCGYAASYGPGAGVPYSGAGHGGQGGQQGTSARGTTYGSITTPATLGSGGNYGNLPGGGLAVLSIGGILHLNGAILADGGSNPGASSSGGAAGSVRITAAALDGTGTVRARGGVGYRTNADMGGGGGGRIAVILTGANTFAGVTFNAAGGAAQTGGTVNGAEHGAAGTVYLQTASQGAGKGTVTIDNSVQSTGARTDIPAFTNAVANELKYVSITVTNRGAMAVTTNATVAALTVASTNEALYLGTNSTVLEVNALNVKGTAYTRGGLYTTNNWNGYTPVPANVTGAGAILLQRPGGTVFTFR
jgi:hypothetical protein